MPASLPADGTIPYGDQLRGYLQVAHNADGTEKGRQSDIYMSTYDTDPASTDHTAAFNAAYAAAKAIISAGQAKVRILLDSRREYTLGGACTTGGNTELAQVPLPFSQTIAGTIELCGMPGADNLYLGLGQSGTVIRSTISAAPTFSDATTGIASMFGGPATFRVARTFGSFNYLQFSFKDLHIRATNPKIAGIDCGFCNGLMFDNLVFDTDCYASIPGGKNFTTGSFVLCTNPQACPIIFPQTDAYLGTVGGSLYVAGWRCGPMIGELLQLQTLQVAYVTGPALGVDVSYHANRIGFFNDLNNAIGVAAYYPKAGFDAGYAPTTLGSASQRSASGQASMVEIDTWNIQRDAGQTSSSLNRTHDVWDTNGIMPIKANINRIDAGIGTVIGGHLLTGTGASNTGAMPRCRLYEMNISAGVQTPPSVPASTVAIRNPFFNDAMINISGGTVTAITINGVASGVTTGHVLVPACASLALTYSVAPTWTWQTF